MIFMMKSNRDLPEQEEGEQVLCFFYSKIVSLNNSPTSTTHLRTLIIIGQLNVTPLTAISELTALKELWIVECGIKEVPFLGKILNLEKLYLYSNELNYIPDLKELARLKILFLSNNNIRDVTILSKLISLQELNVANNKLERIPKIFSRTSELSCANFAGNPLHCLTDVRNLATFRKLNRLMFTDPLYGECPLVSLCNYRFYVIDCLPRIRELDHYPVYNEEKQWITYFFQRQIMYYNMLSHKYFNTHIESLRVKQRMYQESVLQFRERLYAIKRDTRLCTDTNAELGRRHSVERIKSKIETMKKELSEWEELATAKLYILQQQLIITSEYCGNINFVEYHVDIADEITELCQRTLQESVCLNLQSLGVVGIKLHSVTKVTNNAINAVNVWYNDEATLDVKPNEKNLAIISSPGVTSIENWPFLFFKTGLFLTTKIKLTNCLATADTEWLNKVFSSQKGTQILDKYDKCKHRRVCLLVQSLLTFADESHNVHDKTCRKHRSKFGTWCLEFNLGNNRIKNPVFVVEYEYILQEFKNNSLQMEEEDHALSTEWNKEVYLNLSNNNIVRCLQMEEQRIYNLTKICISHQNLQAIDHTLDLPNLEELDISYNKLTEFPNSRILKNMKVLDVSFNSIKLLNITEALFMLQTLNVSWNLLSNCLLTYETLKTYVPHLHIVDISNNPFQDIVDHNSVECLSMNYLPELRHDNDNICIDPMLSKNKLPCSFNICKYNDKEYKGFKGHKDIKNVRELHIKEKSSIENLLKQPTKIKQLCAMYSSLTDFSMVTPLRYLLTLNLMGNFILSLDGFTQTSLPVLKCLDLTDNLLTSLQPMGAFHSLQEFYCAHNKISDLSNIDNMKSWQMIRVIDLCKNPIEASIVYKLFLIFHLPKVKYISEYCVQESDIIEAKCMFGNRLDKTMLNSMYTLDQLENITQLSIANCSLKKVDLRPNILPHLESLDLSKNQITSIWGTCNLQHLRTLCLSYNCLQTFDENSLGDDSNVFCSLSTLFLDHNSITSVKTITKERMPLMRHLFLNHNYLESIDDIGQCPTLEVLILDCNEIEILNETDFCRENNLKLLSIGKNKIKSLDFIKQLQKMEKLYLCNNNIENKSDVEFIPLLQNLEEFTVENNPVNVERYNHLFENFELKGAEA